MRKIREILRLRHERGLTHRTIAEAVRVGAATVSEYLAKAKAKGLGWPLPEELSDAKLEQVFRHSTLLFRLGAENLPVGAYGDFEGGCAVHKGWRVWPRGF